MDYFITSDKELFKKARAIYYYTGSKCEPVLLPNPEEAKFEKVESALKKL